MPLRGCAPSLPAPSWQGAGAGLKPARIMLIDLDNGRLIPARRLGGETGSAWRCAMQQS